MDQQILLWINQGWSHPWLDVFFSWVSGRAGFSVPLTLLMLALWSWRYRWDGLKLWIALLLVIALGDALGNQLKHLLLEHRPCYDLASLVRIPGSPPGSSCGSSLTGDPSNHALNFFAVAAFITYTFRSWRWGVPMFVIAVAVGLSRVYLAKHYPHQVLIGAAIGIAWGLLCGWLSARFFEWYRGIRRDNAPGRPSADGGETDVDGGRA